MKAVAFLIPFILLGVATLFIAFSGGPGAAREAYLTRGGRMFRAGIALVFILGLGVPGLVLAGGHGGAGSSGPLRSKDLSHTEEKGKLLFSQACASCHTLAAVNARGVTGPNLDEIGEVTPKRVLSAIRNGGTGQGRMPAKLYEGAEAREVAEFVSQVAGR